MKRKIVLLLTALTVVSVVTGCGNTGGQEAESKIEATTGESVDIQENVVNKEITGLTGSVLLGQSKEVTEPYTVPVIELTDEQIDSIKEETIEIEDYLNPTEKVVSDYAQFMLETYGTDNAKISMDELTDEKCREITGFESVDAFKEAAKESYNVLFKEIEKEQLNDIISTKILSDVNSIPGLDEYIYAKTSEYLSIIDNMNSNSPEVIADYIVSLGYEDADSYVNDTIEKIAGSTPRDILYTSIATKKELEINETEFDKFLEDVAANYNITKPALLSLFSTEYSTGEDYWKHQYIIKTVGDDILNGVTIEKTECGDDLIERFFF